MPRDGDTPLIPEQRRAQVLDIVRARTVVSIVELANLFGVTTMTIRRDVAMLQRRGDAHSVPGGVYVGPASLRQDGPNDAVSEAIRVVSARAARLVRENMTVFVHASAFARPLASILAACAGVTLVTDSPAVVRQWVDAGKDAIFTGGLIDPALGAAFGSPALATLRELALDLSFIGCRGWDAESGAHFARAEAEVVAVAMEVSSSSVLLAECHGHISKHPGKSVPLAGFDVVFATEPIGSSASRAIPKLVQLEVHGG